MDQKVVHIASSEDTVEIISLLQTHQLPVNDIHSAEITFYIIREHGELIACAGIESFGKEALLRSVAVQKELTGQGIGGALIDVVLNKAKESGISKLYLLTETAQQFFEAKSFSVSERDKAPEEVKKSSEFAELCSMSAVLMEKTL